MALTAGLWLYVIVIGLVLLFAVFSNGLVIYCVVRMKRLRSVTNVLICNLAVSDILLAGFVMPQKLHDISHTDAFYEGNVLCKIVNFFPVFVITSSIYTLVFVSVERRRAIKESQKQQITCSSLNKIFPGLWIFSLIVSIPTLIEYAVNEVTITEGNVTSTFLSCGSQHMPTSYSMLNAVFVILVSYICPVIVMFKNYIQLAIFVWRKGRQIHVASTGSDHFHVFKGRIRIVKLLVVVACIFAASWLPFFITLLYAKITSNDASNDASGFVNLFLIALATFSTAYNVVLYVVYNPSFSRAIKQVFRFGSGDSVPPQSEFRQQSFNHGTLQTGALRVETITSADRVGSVSRGVDQVHIQKARSVGLD